MAAFSAAPRSIVQDTWTPGNPTWPFFPQKCFEDAAAFIVQLDDPQSASIARCLYTQRLRTEALAAARMLFNSPNASDKTRSDAVGILSWWERAYNRTLALQHGATIFETCYRYESLWLARALRRDHFTGLNVVGAVSSQMNAFEIASISHIGSEKIHTPVEVPDAGMIGAIVPHLISYRGNLDVKVGPSVSLIEHFDLNALEEYYAMRLDERTLRPVSK